MVSQLIFLLLLPLVHSSIDDSGRSSGNSTISVAPIPEDNFEGSKRVYIICVKQNPGDQPKWDWIVLEKGILTNTYQMISGAWETNTCTYGSVTSFHVSKADYLDALRTCKKNGYTAAQPSESTFGGWYPFKVGNVITGYYYKTVFTELGVYYPTTQIPACGGTGVGGNKTRDQVIIPNDDFAGGQTVYPVCVKCCRFNSWDWLYSYKSWIPGASKYYTVQGQWNKHLCGFGYAESFRISTADYNKFLKMCLDQGYETLQVARTNSEGPRPVQVGNFYVDTYVSGTKYPAMVVPECVASNDGAGNADVIDSSNSNSGGESSSSSTAPTSCNFPGQPLKVGEERNYQDYVYTCQLSNNEANLVALACLEAGAKHPPGDHWVVGTKPFQYIFECYKDPFGKLTRLVVKCLYAADNGQAELGPGENATVGAQSVTCTRVGENQFYLEIK